MKSSDRPASTTAGRSTRCRPPAPRRRPTPLGVGAGADPPPRQLGDAARRAPAAPSTPGTRWPGRTARPAERRGGRRCGAPRAAGQHEPERPDEVAEGGGGDPEPRVARQHEHRPLGPAAPVPPHQHEHAPQRQRGEADAGQVDQHRAPDAVEHADAQLVDRGPRAAGHLVAAVLDPRPARPQHVGDVEVGAVAEQHERQVDEHAQRPPRARVGSRQDGATAAVTRRPRPLRPR